MFNRYAKSALTLVLLTFLALCQIAPVQANPLDDPFIRVVNAQGKVVSGGKVKIYAAGTNNLSTIYSESTLTTTLVNPVIADSGGKAAAIWLAAASYKIRITDANDVTLFERDNYVVTDLTALSTINYPVAAKTTAYTIAAADDGAAISADASSASPLVITALAQTRGNGFPFCVKNMGATGTVTVSPDAGETVDGASDYSLTTQYQSVCFVSRGAAGWLILNHFDPSGTFSTASTFNETITLNDDIVAPPVTLTDAATISWNMSTGTNFVVTLGGNRTLDAPTGEVAGQFGTLRVIQDGTGARTLTLDASYASEGGLTMRPDPTISASTLYRYDVRGANDVILTRIWTSASDSIGVYREYDLGVFNDDATLTQAHGLGRYPAAIQVYLENTTTDLSYAAADRVPMTYDTISSDSGCVATSNATNVLVTCGVDYRLIDRTTFNGAQINEASWKVILRIYE